MLPIMIKATFNITIKQVTNVRTIAKCYAGIKSLLENANRNPQVAGNIHYSTSTAVRSVLNLKRLKSYSQNILNVC